MKLLSVLLFTAAAATPVAADTDRSEAVRRMQSPVVAPVGPPMAGSTPTPAPVTPPTPAPVTPPTPAPVNPPPADNVVVIPVTDAPVSPPVSVAQPVTVAQPVSVAQPVAPAISGDEPAISGDEPTPSIIDLAAADGKYGTLLSAVTNTPGVLDAIAASFPVTIFGPTDAAFDAIAETVAGLDEATLATILAGHVVEGVFTAEMVIDAGCVELMTLAGNMVRVMVKDGMVMVNDATVVQPDIIGEGGVIHGIDTVILPDTFMPCPAPEEPMITTGKGSKKAGSMSSGKGGSGKGSSTKSPSSGKGGSGKGSSGKGMRRRA